MQVTKFTEVRTTTGFIVDVDRLVLDGHGYDRSEYKWEYGINAGPSNNAYRGHDHDRVLRTRIKVTPQKSAPGWVSFREVGRNTRGRTTYMKDTANVTVDGVTTTVAQFVTDNA